MGKVQKWLCGYFPDGYIVIYCTTFYTYVYVTDDLYKWLHYNYVMASYYRLCHVPYM